MRFTPDESDRLLRLARVFARARQVFDDGESAARWMALPNRALGGVAPLTLLDTDIGVDQVREELGRIEHGIFA
jgi:putative toxin-antitoxin system antitoxin component (TIGR02293 family)